MKKINPILAVITDTHLNSSNSAIVNNIFKQFISLIKSLGLDKCVHMGDFFTSRQSQTLNNLFLANEIFDEFEKEKIHLYIIAGNHDKVLLSSRISYLSIVCRNRKYIHLFEDENIIEYNGYNLCFMPYFREGIDYLSRLLNLTSSIDNKNKSILFTHTSINGVRNNDGTIVSGDNEQNFFDDFDLVLSGHYHNKNSLSDKIHYIGSAYQANFGEDTDKGFTVIYEDLSIELEHSKFPIYKKIILDAEDVKETSKMLMEYSDSSDNIRFVFKGDQESLEKLDANKFEKVGISVQFDNIIDRGVLFSEVEEAKIISFDKKSVLKNYIIYANQQDFTPEQLKQGMKLITQTEF